MAEPRGGPPRLTAASRLGARRSPVFARIHDVIRRIPRGRVATYGQVAALAGLPNHARHVGFALHALPEGTRFPWHRVLNARGGISLRSEAGALTQRLRLLREGVRFGARGRVRLAEFQWRPTARAAGRERAHGRARGPVVRPGGALDPRRRLG